MKRFKKITFFDCPEEINIYLKANAGKTFIGTDEIFIAMTPAALAELKRKGMTAKNTADYFTNDSHMKVLKKSAKVTDWIVKHSKFANPGIDVNQSLKDSFMRWTRMTVHYCLWVIEIVLNAIEFHRPEVISASISGKRTVSNLQIEAKEKYLGAIVKSISQAKNIRYADIEKAPRSSIVLAIAIFFEYIASSFTFVTRYIGFICWAKFMILKNYLRNKRPIILMTTRGTDSIVSIIKEKEPKRPVCLLKGPVAIFRHVPQFIIRCLGRRHAENIKEQKCLFNKLKDAILAEQEIFSYRGISFSQMVLEKVMDNIANYTYGQLLRATMLDSFINGLRPSIAISTGNRFDDIMVAELCRDKSIPSVLISHGSHVKPKNEFEYLEWGEHGKAFLRTSFSHFALQSPLAEDYLKAFPSDAKPLKTGPIVWGKSVKPASSKRLFNKMFGSDLNFNETRVLVHAGTSKPSNSLRYYVYETPDEYIQGISDLAQAVEGLENTILIVRFRPRKDIGISDIRGLVPFSEKVILSTEESFVDVLGMSDLLVSFSSTTIEEALQNRIPVLLYGGWGRYQHISAFEIKKNEPIKPSAIYHISDRENLKVAIKNILDLKIDAVKDKKLFMPYMYEEGSRESLLSLLKD